MRTQVKVVFDTTTWPEDDLRWVFKEGIVVECENKKETTAAIKNTYGLGHDAEVTYLD
jgi:hypothetical protein